MGLLDAFKKKTQDSSTSNSSSLEDLPPIPVAPFAEKSDDSQSKDLSLDIADAPDSLETPSIESLDSSLPPQGLEVPDQEKTFDEISLESTSSLEAELAKTEKEHEAFFDKMDSTDSPLAPDNIEDSVDLPPLEDSIQPDVADDSNVPSPDLAEESTKENVEEKEDSTPVDFAAEVSSPQEEESAVQPAEVDSPNPSAEPFVETELPNFQDLQDDISLARTGEQLSITSADSADVTTESLLLKSIFIEREHYANLLFSLKRVRDDLKKSSPQQRKLNQVDSQVAKQYTKLSVLFENFNENLMIIEHILSNEQF